MKMKVTPIDVLFMVLEDLEKDKDKYKKFLDQLRKAKSEQEREAMLSQFATKGHELMKLLPTTLQEVVLTCEIAAIGGTTTSMV